MPVGNPFLRTGPRSADMAAWTLAALLIPCAGYSILYRSPFVFHLIGYVLIGMAAETCYTLLVQRRLRLFCTGSGLAAGLLAASVPASMPFLPMLLAILLSVWFIKLPFRKLPIHLNAAMTGRLFLMLFYPVHVTHWGTPTADVISTATPQELYRSEGYQIEWGQLLFGRIEGVWEELFLLVPGSPGETFPLLLLLLGLILCRKGILAWRPPVAFILSFGAATWLSGQSPLFNLCSAAALFSAVFIVSDPVSSPMSKGGQVAFGMIIGITNALIRHYTYYTEAIVYAVLVGNLCTPFLDRLAFEARGRMLMRRRGC